MITVITLTYKRHEILEEAINSFILQDVTDCEMIVLNDAPETTYTLDLSKEQQHILDTNRNTIKIINEKTRYPSIMKKLRKGFDLAKHEYMYRLDDDDLLSETSLKDVIDEINSNPTGYDVYRSKGAYHFTHNKFTKINDNVNNGNIYTKTYIDGISEWHDASFGEDVWLTYGNDVKTYNFDSISMAYRWGMNTYHVSGLGNIPQEEMFVRIDKMMSDGNLRDKVEDGDIALKPTFKHDYYKQIREGLKVQA
jgi:hypothetical protein